jgi:1-acyl-sn-glycerol-3-phosphate acyltransferase
MAQRSLPKRLWYDFLRVACRIVGVVVFQIRVSGREHEPIEGGALVVSNHQSHLDPVLVGLCFDRRMNYVARLTLFRFPPFRWLINSLDAIPLDREGLGIQGIKESLRRLKAGEMILIFPEGTRTPDGEVGELKPGFLALARRARVPLVPVAIDGAFDAWPKRNMLPRPAAIRVCLGEPIQPAEFASLSDDELMDRVDLAIRACHREARLSKLSAKREKPRNSKPEHELRLKRPA